MDASTSPVPMQRLPSGRHRLERSEVAASQRGRLIVAIAAAVADKGYAATTVADVVERATVSRRTFYEQFESKEDCFIAAFDLGVEYVLGRLAAAAASENGELGWRERMRSDLRTYLKVLAEEPAFAFSLHVECLSAGPAALAHRSKIFALFTERTRRLYELARAEDSSKPELPIELFRMHSGGVDELIRECLRERGPEALPKLADPIWRASLAMFGEASV
jgi:AcrR family transcriptional regulator